MDSSPSDQSIALARGGDEGACRELVEHLYPTVIKIVRRHLPRRDEEEDLAQEVFMKVFAKLDRFSGKEPIAHWVSRIAVNTCFDRLRRQRVRPVMNFAELDLDEAEFLERALSESASAPSDASPEAAGELLEKLFASLNPREETVIRLLDLHEFSVQETCNQTGWGASKVKVTAMRARRKLKAALQRLESETNSKSAT
jgi:RNA polymerase sigma-70 factor (ECF subfamily)